MGYQVKQYKLTSQDVEAINASRPPNWFPRVKVGDEHPMILMGKVLLDGEYFHWVDPNATEPAPTPVASAPTPVAVPAAVAPEPVVVPETTIAPAPVPATPPVPTVAAPAVPVATPAAVTPAVAPVPPVVATPAPVALTPEQHAALNALGIPATPAVK
jgi:hypothetical protein